MSELQNTIQTLRDYNMWRRADEDMEQPDPRKIGQAIDKAIEAMEELAAITEQRDRLAVAAQSVVDQWDSPFWRQVEHTGVFIDYLRKAIESAKGGQP